MLIFEQGSSRYGLYLICDLVLFTHYAGILKIALKLTRLPMYENKNFCHLKVNLTTLEQIKQQKRRSN